MVNSAEHVALYHGNLLSINYVAMDDDNTYGSWIRITYDGVAVDVERDLWAVRVDFHMTVEENF